MRTWVAPTIVAVLVAGCGAASSAWSASSRCAWYSPTVGGQMAIVSATGPACRSAELGDWIASRTRRVWISTGDVGGTLIAQLGRGGTTVRVWQVGFAPPTERAAGYLADDFESAGWRVEVPT